MSSPANELAKFRSYSYYHVLAVCDSSKTADQLSAATGLNAWQHPGGPTSSDPYAVQQVPGGGNYCVLINGSTDASFTITKATWQSLTAASAVAKDRNTSLATEGTLSVSEPRGITFLDIVIRSCISLGIDSSSAFWVLKTFFVGYTFDTKSGNDGIEHITNIPPVTFIVYDLTGSFGMEGGQYEMSFVAAANGSARLPQYSKVTKGANIPPQGTLYKTLTTYAEVITRNYDKYYDCIEHEVKAMDESLGNKLRKVKYVITCDDEYKKDVYTIAGTSPNSKDVADCTSATPVSISAGSSIESGIQQIVGWCQKIKDEAAGINTDQDKKYIHKISSWLHTYPVNDDKNNPIMGYEVGYRLQRQETPTSYIFSAAANGTLKESDPNVITFDYTYTGKNIDIVEMDLKMNLGMVYLQGMTMSSPYKYPGGQTQNTSSHIDPGGLARNDNNNIPVFFGTQVKTANARSGADSKSTAAQVYTMAKHASLEVLETTMKITGNSQLLGSINAATSSVTIRDGKGIVQELTTPNAALQNWMQSPVFAKVNIKMPRNNDDIALFTGTQTSTEALTSNGSSSNDYAVDFWFTGYYYVYMIENIFEGGEFHQVLNAIGIPQTDSFSQTNAKAAIDQNATSNIRTESCYDNNVGCVSYNTQNASVGIYPEAINSPQQYITPALAQAVQDDPTLQQVTAFRNYESLDQTIKDQFVIQSKNTGIPVFTLVAIASAESNLNPSAQNRYTGDAGFFQFQDSTWKIYGKNNDPKDPIANIEAGALFTADNYKIAYKVLGRAPTLAELYLYQLGAGNASPILKAIKNGEGASYAAWSPNDPVYREKLFVQNNIKGRSNNDVINWAQNLVFHNFKSGFKVDEGAQIHADEAALSTLPLRKGYTSAKRNIAATNNCTDQQKLKEPDKNTTCPKGPDQPAANPGTPAANSTPTGAITPPNSGPFAPVVAQKPDLSNLVSDIALSGVDSVGLKLP